MVIMEKETKMEDRCPECGGSITATTSERICRVCGLVINRTYVHTNYIKGTALNVRRSFRQSVDTGKMHDYVGGLGSYIGFTSYQKSKYIKDSKGKSLPPKDQTLFNRLKNNHNTFNRIKGKETEYRILKILKIICARLSLPKHISIEAGYRYRKLVGYDATIINNITCICFCIWDAIRVHKHKTCFQELVDAFKSEGHRVGGRLLIRDGCLFREYLSIQGVKKTSSKHPRDYIERHLASIKNKRAFIKKRMKFKQINNFESVDHYLTKLENQCVKIMDVLYKPLDKFCGNPLIVACSCIYATDVILSNNNNNKRVLTQKILSEACQVTAYSIRDIYVKFFKKYIKKINKEIII